MKVVDFCSGPGGWCSGAKQLGIDPIGIEIDADACATRAAAGLTTIRGDIMQIKIPGTILGLIGSPPCPQFSLAGKQEAVSEIPDLIGCLDRDMPYQACMMLPSETTTGDMLSPDALMCIEPFTWVNDHRPEWVALEQVRAVLPIWEAGARYMQRLGYSTWTGLLDAADYGVPQNRVRAILIANRTRTIQPPLATHAQHPQPSLFGDEPEPWVSAWDGLDRWGITPDATHINTGRDFRIKGDRSSGQTIDMRERPAPTFTAKSGGQWQLGFARRNDIDDGNEYRERDLRPADRPAQTLTEKARSWEWTKTRPATTTDAIRLAVPQALVLQGFPPDYPVQGSKTSQFKQVGNAVPPPLATAVLKAAA